MMQDLVFIGSVNDEPYTTDKIISDYSGNQLKVVKNLIRNHKNDLTELGVCILKMLNLSKVLKVDDQLRHTA